MIDLAALRSLQAVAAHGSVVAAADALVPRLGRAALDDLIVAVAARDPVPTREVVAVHRRTLDDSPAVSAALRALAGSAGAANP